VNSPEASAAAARLDDGSEAAPVLLVHRVEDGVDAAVRGAQPLGHRHHLLEDLELLLRDVRAELDPREDDVERQPGEHEQDDHGHQHLDDLHLALLLHAVHLGVLRLTGNGPRGDLDPDEHVAERYQGHGQQVAGHQVGQQEVKVPVRARGPDLLAEELRLRVGREEGVGEDLLGGHQVEEEQPRDGGHQGDHPYADYHDAGTSLRHLLQGPPDGNEPARGERSQQRLFLPDSQSGIPCSVPSPHRQMPLTALSRQG